jgi:hypothetical protein
MLGFADKIKQSPRTRPPRNGKKNGRKLAGN